jgi:hypothetical protein
MDIELPSLTKMQLRKLNALKKSVGDKLGEVTFLKWFKDQPKKGKDLGDKHADKIVEVLTPLVMDKKIRIPKTGYMLKRGRGRVIVEAAVGAPRAAAKAPCAGRKKKV